MYFLTTLVCTIIATVLWFLLRDRKALHLDILAIAFGAATLMWLIDCIFEAASGNPFISFASEDIVKDGWISLASLVGGVFFWLVLSFILNNNKKSETK